MENLVKPSALNLHLVLVLLPKTNSLKCDGSESVRTIAAGPHDRTLNTKKVRSLALIPYGAKGILVEFPGVVTTIVFV